LGVVDPPIQMVGWDSGGALPDGASGTFFALMSGDDYLWRSTDGGAHFSSITPAGPAGRMGLHVATAAGHVYVIDQTADKRFMRSSADNGETWSAWEIDNTVLLSYGRLVVDAVDSNWFWIAQTGDAYDAGGNLLGPVPPLVRSEDGGQTLLAEGAPGSSPSLLAVDRLATSAPSNRLLLWFDSNGFFRSEDGGADWTAVVSGPPTTSLSDLAQVGPSSFLAVGEVLWFSSDAGQSWPPFGDRNNQPELSFLFAGVTSIAADPRQLGPVLFSTRAGAGVFELTADLR
jgi:hypothetical protein